MPLHVSVVHLNDAGKENREEGNEENGEGQKVFAGEVAHKWQPCSTSDDTIVKWLLSQLWFHFAFGMLQALLTGINPAAWQPRARWSYVR
ncbi:MAG: hypothetical protein QOK38_864 [Acidobacteriaceae bacterium]|jgi:hypothetical protein|nr:hypothetical protein [Acidobacteriaceae bacterium]